MDRTVLQCTNELCLIEEEEHDRLLNTADRKRLVIPIQDEYLAMKPGVRWMKIVSEIGVMGGLCRCMPVICSRSEQAGLVERRTFTATGELTGSMVASVRASILLMLVRFECYGPSFPVSCDMESLLYCHNSFRAKLANARCHY